LSLKISSCEQITPLSLKTLKLLLVLLRGGTDLTATASVISVSDIVIPSEWSAVTISAFGKIMDFSLTFKYLR
jgi:hypothetical protein